MFDTIPPRSTITFFVRNKLKSLSKVFALALIAGTTFTGVKESTAADSSGSKGTIALSLKTITNDDFQKALADAVKAQVESTGYTIAGILLSAQLDTVHPIQGDPYLLDTIAACVIGGVSLAGGEGRVALAVAGALIIG